LYYIGLTKSDFALGGSAFAQLQNALGVDVPEIKDASYFKRVFNTIQLMISNSMIAAGHDISAGGLITSLLEMTFSNTEGGLSIDLSSFKAKDLINILFAENPALLIQANNNAEFEGKLKGKSIDFIKLGKPIVQRSLQISYMGKKHQFDINRLRDNWFRPSFLMDRKQSGEILAKERFENYGKHCLEYIFNKSFEGKLSQYELQKSRRIPSNTKAAIIREKGVNGDREMAWSLYQAGFDVKDVHMTDLIAGRENLEDVQMIVFVGGFSNSDVLGSAKGWAGAFTYNSKARLALENFYKRADTLSLGICNGCQLMVELGLLYPEHSEKIEMHRNKSEKFESAFLNVDITENNSVMLQSMVGNKLGIWVAHGEGRFHFPMAESEYHIPLKYSNAAYPANPNGSDFNTAAVCSKNGRHLAMMPHLERAVYPWQWAHYRSDRNDEVTPWVEAFVNARKWIEEKNRE
jgi:phosphoribosylformylglycinamidine synthase